LDQQNYEPPVPPRRVPLDPWTIGVILIAAVALLACMGAVGVVCLLSIVGSPPPPATPPPASNPTAISVLGTPLPTALPTVNSADIGKFVNPYLSAELQGMTVLQIDVRDQDTGNYVRSAQLTGTELDKFVEAFNVSVKTVAPDSSCPDHVRLSITRADNSVVTIGVCLKGVVILRGGVPDLGGADAPMYPGFSDTIAPYLPPAYKELLDF
jgi:hypothetical protein